jgi:hypothetical protein
MMNSFFMPVRSGSCSIFFGSSPAVTAQAFGARQLGQPGAYPRLEIVDLDELLRRLLHRLLHLGRHQRAAERGERAVGVDERLHTKTFVERRVQVRGRMGGLRLGGQ